MPALVQHMPAPDVLLTELKTRINQAYYDLVQERGPVHTPQDTFSMQRKIGGELDRFGSYKRAFEAAIKLLKELQAEELIEAVGEQDGVPNQALTIPDAEGDIRLSNDAPSVYNIDTQQLLAVIFTQVAATAQRLREEGHDFDEILSQTFEGSMATLMALGKFEPQVSKVRAWADSLARDGNDRDSSVVSGAITKKTPYKGVKFERKAPKS